SAEATTDRLPRQGKTMNVPWYVAFVNKNRHLDCHARELGYPSPLFRRQSPCTTSAPAGALAAADPTPSRSRAAPFLFAQGGRRDNASLPLVFHKARGLARIYNPRNERRHSHPVRHRAG